MRHTLNSGYTHLLHARAQFHDTRSPTHHARSVFVVTRATVGVLALSAYATVQVRMPRVAPAVLFLLVALVGKTLVKESEGLAKPLLQPSSGPPQDFATGRALAMEQMREVAARPHARSPRSHSLSLHPIITTTNNIIIIVVIVIEITIIACIVIISIIVYIISPYPHLARTSSPAHLIPKEQFWLRARKAPASTQKTQAPVFKVLT